MHIYWEQNVALEELTQFYVEKKTGRIYNFKCINMTIINPLLKYHY